MSHWKPTHINAVRPLQVLQAAGPWPSLGVRIDFSQEVRYRFLGQSRKPASAAIASDRALPRQVVDSPISALRAVTHVAFAGILLALVFGGIGWVCSEYVAQLSSWGGGVDWSPMLTRP